MIANKLKPGDEIRVIAPSRNLTEVWHVAHHHAVDFWRKEGFNLTFFIKSRPDFTIWMAFFCAFR